MNNLNEKQKIFCDEYIIDFNATQAAIRAGYSEKTAYSMGQRLLKKVEIQLNLVQLKSERSIRTQITQDRVLLEISRLAFNDPRKAFGIDGDLLPIFDWPDEVAAAISSIKITDTKTRDNSIIRLKEVKFWDKGRQLELAAKHLGLLEKDNKQRQDQIVNEPLEIVIIENRATTSAA